jgi:hypothetical protein
MMSIPIVRRVRRIHGLEHATIHILSQRFPGVPLAGHSNPTGFWLLGEVPTPAVESAVYEAIQRLSRGEKRLAIAPLCGTNVVAIGTLTGLAASLSFWSAPKRLRDKLDRLPVAITLSTLAVFAALPLGVWLQAHVTTSAEANGLNVKAVQRSQRGGITAHQVFIQD